MNTTAKGITAAALLIVPVVAELVSEPLGDGTAFKVGFAASQLVGWLLLASVCRGLADLHPPVGRRDRVGARLLVAGCVAEMLFAATYGLLEVVTGEPEVSFVFFSLGLLLVTVGGLLRGSRLRRAGVDLAGTALMAAAVLGFLAIAVGSDPFHDIFLLTGYAAWAAVGLGASRGGRPAASGDSGLSRSPVSEAQRSL
jgi:hypothetical protein